MHSRVIIKGRTLMNPNFYKWSYNNQSNLRAEQEIRRVNNINRDKKWNDKKMNPRDDERTLPRTTIINLFKNRLGDCRLSGAAIELVLRLSHDFVYKLADEANNICSQHGKKTISNSHVLSALKELKIDDYIDKLGSMYDCELDIREKEDEIASKMQFKKKKKKHKSNEVDEELAREQERLFNDAHNLYLQSQASEMLMRPVMSPMASALSLERSPSAPVSMPGGSPGGVPGSKPTNQPKPGILLELEKKLSEKCMDAVESTDFDALGTKS